jgi:hypothetical protein
MPRSRPNRRPKTKISPSQQRNIRKRSQNEEPVTQATQEAPTQNFFKKAATIVGSAYIAYAAAFTALSRWNAGKSNCYGFVVNDPTGRYNVPGDIAGQPAQERTCSANINGAKADGAKEPLTYAPDGCSVTCPPQTHPVYSVIGESTWDLFGVPLRQIFAGLGVPVEPYGDDSHFYKQVSPGRFAHKRGRSSAPTDRDGSGRLISCPPEADHVYTKSLFPLLPILRETSTYGGTPDKLCGFICVLDSAQDKHALEDTKQQNNRGR